MAFAIPASYEGSLQHPGSSRIRDIVTAHVQMRVRIIPLAL